MTFRLNRATRNPVEAWTTGHGGKRVSNAGHYYVENANGGHRLVQIVDGSGTERNIGSGRGSKSDIWEQINVILNVMKGLGE